MENTEPVTPAPQDGFWGIKEIATYCAVSPYTVKDWYRNPAMGFPQPHHFGRCVRWKISEIKAWAEARRDKRALKPAHVLRIKNAATLQTGRTYEV